MEEQIIDESKILSYEEEKKIKDQNYELKRDIHDMQDCNDDIKDQTLPIAGMIALSGGITHAVSWLYKHLKLNSQARSDYINSLPQNPDQEATLQATKEALQNTYGIDTTGLTYSNIVGKVKDIFDGCYTTVRGSFGNSETIINSIKNDAVIMSYIEKIVKRVVDSTPVIYKPNLRTIKRIDKISRKKAA